MYFSIRSASAVRGRCRSRFLIWVITLLIVHTTTEQPLFANNDHLDNVTEAERENFANNGGSGSNGGVTTGSIAAPKSTVKTRREIRSGVPFLNPRGGMSRVIGAPQVVREMDADQSGPVSVRAATWALTEPTIGRALLDASRYAQGSVNSMYLAMHNYREAVKTQPNGDRELRRIDGCINNSLNEDNDSAREGGMNWYEALLDCGGGYPIDEATGRAVYNAPPKGGPAQASDDPNYVENPEDPTGKTTTLAITLHQGIEKEKERLAHIYQFRARWGDILITQKHDDSTEAGMRTVVEKFFAPTDDELRLEEFPPRPLDLLVKVGTVDAYTRISLLTFHRCRFEEKSAEIVKKSNTNAQYALWARKKRPDFWNDPLEYQISVNPYSPIPIPQGMEPLMGARSMYPNKGIGLSGGADYFQYSSLTHLPSRTHDVAKELTVDGSVMFDHELAERFYRLFQDDQISFDDKRCANVFDLMPARAVDDGNSDTDENARSMLSASGQFRRDEIEIQGSVYGPVPGKRTVTDRHELTYNYAHAIAQLHLMEEAAAQLKLILQYSQLARDPVMLEEGFKLIAKALNTTATDPISLDAYLSDKHAQLIASIRSTVKEIFFATEGLGAGPRGDQIAQGRHSTTGNFGS